MHLSNHRQLPIIRWVFLIFCATALSAQTASPPTFGPPTSGPAPSRDPNPVQNPPIWVPPPKPAPVIPAPQPAPPVLLSSVPPNPDRIRRARPRIEVWLQGRDVPQRIRSFGPGRRWAFIAGNVPFNLVLQFHSSLAGKTVAVFPEDPTCAPEEIGRVYV